VHEYSRGFATKRVTGQREHVQRAFFTVHQGKDLDEVGGHAMRKNLPVTQRSYEFCDDVTLMSTTDTQSNITSANAAFIAVSGFRRDEILGQPHNLVRHPDMPQQAFSDMWKTLRAGRSWTALVKNRRKDGDHYWVRANATPIVRKGVITGYMSVRTKPTADEIEKTENLYRAVRERRDRKLGFHQGLIIRTGLLGWTSLLQKISVAWRIRLAMTTLMAATVLILVASKKNPGLIGLLLGLSVLAVLATILWLERQIARPSGRFSNRHCQWRQVSLGRTFTLIVSMRSG